MPKYQKNILINSPWSHIPQHDTDDYQSSEVTPIFSLILGMLYNCLVNQT